MFAQLWEYPEIKVKDGKYGVEYGVPFKKHIVYVNDYINNKDTLFRFSYKYKWGVQPIYDSIWRFRNNDYYKYNINLPLLTKKGEKYGFILNYKVGTLDDYRDSLVEYPAIYDTVYYNEFGTKLSLKKENKWGYVRSVRSSTVGFRNYLFSMDGRFIDRFQDHFYVSPIVYDLPPDGEVCDYNLLVKDGKCGFLGQLDRIIPYEYDTLIYIDIGFYGRKFEWRGRGIIEEWIDFHKNDRAAESQVSFIKAIKDSSFTFFMVTDDVYNELDTFKYKQILPWFNMDDDVRFVLELYDNGHAEYDRPMFLVTKLGEASYLLDPFNMDSIIVLNTDNSSFYIDSNASEIYYDLDTLQHHSGLDDVKLLESGWSTTYNRRWNFFNYWDDFDQNSVYIVKLPDTNIAYVYNNMESIIRLPYNPCDNDQMILITKDFTDRKDSIIFTLINSRNLDTIYRCGFPFNEKLTNGQLYINYPKHEGSFIPYSDKYKYQNAGLRLGLYFIPDAHFTDEKEFSKFKNRKYYYKLGYINTCKMKFYPNRLIFLQKRPYNFKRIYKANLRRDR